MVLCVGFNKKKRLEFFFHLSSVSIRPTHDRPMARTFAFMSKWKIPTGDAQQELYNVLQDPHKPRGLRPATIIKNVASQLPCDTSITELVQEMYRAYESDYQARQEKSRAYDKAVDAHQKTQLQQILGEDFSSTCIGVQSTGLGKGARIFFPVYVSGN